MPWMWHVLIHWQEVKTGRRGWTLKSSRLIRRAWELNSVVVDAKYGPVQMEFKLVLLLGLWLRVKLEQRCQCQWAKIPAPVEGHRLSYDVQGNRMDRHTTATLKSRWFDWAAFEAIEGFTCLRTLSSQIRQFSFLWWHLILTCVLWMSIDPSHQQLPSMCDMGNWNSRTVASIGWNYPTPTNCRIKKVPSWPIFLQCW